MMFSPQVERLVGAVLDPVGFLAGTNSLGAVAGSMLGGSRARIAADPDVGCASGRA
jgi:hypothetical protein